jgi:nucleolar GTP-binding protein
MDNIGNPFSSVKKVLTFDELIDTAFNRAMKIKPPVTRQDALSRTKTLEINRINTAANVIVNNVENIVSNFPSLNLIHPFYLELASILVDVDDLRRSLGRINGVTITVRNLEEEIKDQILNSNSKDATKKLRKIAFARFSSIIKRIKSSLSTIKSAAKKLKQLPGFNPYNPTVVLCGFPNTGKSSFIRLTSTGKPEIASYPFTTKEIIFGHRKFGFIMIQFVDTPGLLDRPLHKRNAIELQALAVFKHLADYLIYLFDVSESASAPLNDQINLYHEIKTFYPSAEFLPTISKSDLFTDARIKEIKQELINHNVVDANGEIWSISSESNIGIKGLLDYLELKIQHNVLHNPKFKHVSSMEIAEDQLTLNEMDEDLL